MSFANLQITTDREQALAAFDAKMAAAFPGWERMLAELTGWIAEWVADEYPDLANLSADMAALAFRTFGETVLGVPPITTAPSTADSTWTLTDTAGHTIPAGTQVQIADGDALWAFAVVSEVAVPSGSSVTAAGGVELQALVAGEATNGLTAAPTLIDALAFVDSIALVGATAGGVDEEAEEDFLDRLVDEFKLLSKVLILPADVATATRRVAGVARATVVDNFAPGTNEVQTVTVNGSPTGGDYTVKLGPSGDPSDPIAYNASAAAFKTALVASDDFETDDLDVAGNAGGPYTITFKGQHAWTNVAQLELGTNSLTGGTTPAPAFATTTAGVAYTTNNEKMVGVFPIDADGANVSQTVKDAIEAELESRREAGFVFHVEDPGRTPIKVSVEVVAWDGVDHDGLVTSILGVLSDYLSPSNWGLSPFDDNPGVWINESTVYRNELISLVDRVEGVRRVTALTLARQSGTLGTSDVVLGGPAPLPTPGTLTVTVT